MNRKQTRVAWIVVILLSLTSVLGGLVVFFNNTSVEVGSTLAGLVLLPVLPILLIGGMAFLRAKDVKDKPTKVHEKQPSATAEKAEAKNPENTQQEEEARGKDQTVSGLGGWLILIAIGLFGAPLHVLQSYVEYGSAYSASTWLLLTTPGTQVYHPMWAFILIFEPLTSVYFLVAAILLLVLFFRTKRIFKRLMIAYLALNLVFALVDLLLGQSIPAIAAQDTSSAWTGVLVGLASAAIWIPYLLRSQRVQATFIN
jgi:hypothetical protein